MVSFGYESLGSWSVGPATGSCGEAADHGTVNGGKEAVHLTTDMWRKVWERIPGFSSYDQKTLH